MDSDSTTSAVTPLFEDDGSEGGETHRVFQIEDVLEHLFDFLDLEELKSCRSVNKLWKHIANRMMRRKSRIIFDYSYYHGYLEEIRGKMMEINKSYILANKELEGVPFANFYFKGVIPLPMFVTFMRKVGSCIRSLTIVGVLKDPKDPRRGYFDISSLLGRNLKTLTIDRHYNSFKFHISAKSIRFVDELMLGNCAITLDDMESRLSPTFIMFKETTFFMKNDIKLKDFLISDAVDFRRAEIINLASDSMVVDFALFDSSQKIERSVTLENVTVRNWGRCNWDLIELKLNKVPLEEKSSVEISDLTIADTKVKFSSLANAWTITTLALRGATTVDWNSLSNFPNLHSLELENESLALLPYFSDYNLTRIRLSTTKGFKGIEKTVKLQYLLPTEVQFLYLESVDIEAEDDVEPMSVFYLTIVNPIGGFLQLVKKFKAESLFIEDRHISNYINDDDVLNFLKERTASEDIYLGEFNWSRSNPFKNSKFSKVVGDWDQYYYGFSGEPDSLGRPLCKEAIAKYNETLDGIISDYCMPAIQNSPPPNF